LQQILGEWLRKGAGKRDPHELMPEDHVVLRPGPNFHWLMSNPAPAEPPPTTPGQNPTDDDYREAGEHAKRRS
jgi:hypothetical protein